MIILGMTGSIGMGKSTAAAVLRQMGIPVHDADRNVHRLMAQGGAAVERIAAAFPGVVKDGAIDRGALGKRVFGDTAALARLEAILHPMVQAAERAFLANARRRRLPVVVLDVPLLYETRGENRCDAVIVVTAPQFIQSLRVLRRKGMTPQRLKDIVMRQMPDAEKRKRADFVVPTGLGKRASRTALHRVVKKLKHR